MAVPVLVELGIDDAVLDLINQERAKVGVNPLNNSDDIDDAADLQAFDMAQNNRLSEIGFDGSTVATRVANTNYPFSNVGEAIAFGPETPAEVVAQWMNDPVQRNTLLDPTFTDAALGSVANSDGVIYWVETFGGPDVPAPIDPMVEVDPTPVAVDPVMEVDPTPVAVDPMVEVDPTPVAVDPMVEVDPTPVAVDPVMEVDPTPVAVDPMVEVDPTPVAVDPMVEVDPTPIAVDPVTEVDPTLAFTDLVTEVDPTLAFTDLVTEVDPTTPVDPVMAVDLTGGVTTVGNPVDLQPSLDSVIDSVVEPDPMVMQMSFVPQDTNNFNTDPIYSGNCNRFRDRSSDRMGAPDYTMGDSDLMSAPSRHRGRHH